MSVFEESDTTITVSDNDVIEGDTFEVLDTLPENRFHAIVTDPPYNFEDGFMQQEWDDIGSPSEYQEWCREWSEKALRVLKPGGHLIAFSGNRSHHRLMSGVEDAGYEIRDTITWLYANGFPKGQPIERWLDDEYVDDFGDWRGTLKPASEFAVLARAPFSESSSTKNQMEHGTGNLNVVETELESGRYPSNVVLDCVMAELLDLQSGERQGCQPHTISDSGSRDVLDDGGLGEMDDRVEGYDDSGGASRFFYCSKAATSERTHDGAVDNDHPTVKPVDLMGWLTKLVTAEDQWVLDPFAGSGTTAVAAENVNRNCVMIEKDGDYVEIAEQRIEDVSS